MQASAHHGRYRPAQMHCKLHSTMVQQSDETYLACVVLSSDAETSIQAFATWLRFIYYANALLTPMSEACLMPALGVCGVLFPVGHLIRLEVDTC